MASFSIQQHSCLQAPNSRRRCLAFTRCPPQYSHTYVRTRRRKGLRLEALLDQAPAWTLDQIAGLAFGGILLASVLLGSKIDHFIARSQRRDLGLCEQCGGLNDPKTCQENRCPAQTAVLERDN